MGKEFRYLRTVRVTAAVYWALDPEREPRVFRFQHRAGVRPYTSAFALAESCVFTKQSLPPGLCHLENKVPFLPKVQGHFAEFLHHSSLNRLSILYLPTRVGLGYGVSMLLGFPGPH